MVAPGLRAQRLRLVWVLALPFFLLSSPTPFHILLGGLLAVPGLLLRGLAAGFIHKDRFLARHGPYAHLRHPLYLGSFFAGLGVVVAGGRWSLVLVFGALFTWLYSRTIRAEEGELETLFGEGFREYRRAVPALIPRLSVPDPETHSPGIKTFQLRAFVRNRGWEAPLGVLAAFLLLWLRMGFLH